MSVYLMCFCFLPTSLSNSAIRISSSTNLILGRLSYLKTAPYSHQSQTSTPTSKVPVFNMAPKQFKKSYSFHRYFGTHGGDPSASPLNPQEGNPLSPFLSSSFPSSGSGTTSGSSSARPASSSSFISPLVLSPLTASPAPELATPDEQGDFSHLRTEDQERQPTPPADESKSDSPELEGLRPPRLPPRPGRRPIPTALSPTFGPVNHPSQPSLLALDTLLGRAPTSPFSALPPSATPSMIPGPVRPPPSSSRRRAEERNERAAPAPRRPLPRSLLRPLRGSDPGPPRALPPTPLIEPVRHPSQASQPALNRLSFVSAETDEEAAGTSTTPVRISGGQPPTLGQAGQPSQPNRFNLSFVSMETEEEVAGTSTTPARLSGGPPPDLSPFPTRRRRRTSPPDPTRPYFCGSAASGGPLRARSQRNTGLGETITGTSPSSQPGPSSSASTTAAGPSSMQRPPPNTDLQTTFRSLYRPDYVVATSLSSSPESPSGHSSVSVVFSEDVTGPSTPPSLPNIGQRSTLRRPPDYVVASPSSSPASASGESSASVVFSEAVAGPSAPPSLPNTGQRSTLRHPPEYLVASSSSSPASASKESSASALFSDDVADPARPVSPPSEPPSP